MSRKMVRCSIIVRRGLSWTRSFHGERADARQQAIPHNLRRTLNILGVEAMMAAVGAWKARRITPDPCWNTAVITGDFFSTNPWKKRRNAFCPINADPARLIFTWSGGFLRDPVTGCILIG
jgi:hypothetical protein